MKLDVMIVDAQSIASAILFQKGPEVQMYIWIWGPTDTLLPVACPGAVLSLSDTKEHNQVAPRETEAETRGCLSCFQVKQGLSPRGVLQPP